MTVTEIFKNPIFPAPMAGVTDSAFRRIVRELLPKDGKNLLMFSEMVSSNGIHYRNENTLDMLETFTEEKPISVQIFGNDPEVCAEAAKFVEDTGNAAAIDFNCGCPAPKIVKNGDGSALMKNPELLKKILPAIRKATTLPFSLKIRLGFDEENLNAVEIAKIAEDSGADFIAVHGRTRQQYYSGSANWNEIAKVKAAVKIPVIANGDVCDFDSLDEILKITGADGVMVGRAIRGNPGLVGRLLHYFKTGEKLPPPALDEKINTMRRHLEYLIDLKGENTGIREMRKHAAWYTKGMRGGAELRNSFNRAETAEDFIEITERFFSSTQTQARNGI